jgi:hypothetical protein
LLIHEPLSRIHRLIAVNTPFSGSRLAYLLFLLPSVRVFIPRGRIVQELLRATAINVSVSSLYSVFDPHIRETSYLVGAENIVLPMIGHFRPLADPRTLHIISDIVRRR